MEIHSQKSSRNQKSWPASIIVLHQFSSYVASTSASASASASNNLALSQRIVNLGQASETPKSQTRKLSENRSSITLTLMGRLKSAQSDAFNEALHNDDIESNIRNDTCSKYATINSHQKKSSCFEDLIERSVQAGLAFCISVTFSLQFTVCVFFYKPGQFFYKLR